LRLILDYVPNHTSNRHSWFVQSRSSRDNPYRDYYLWRDPGANGGPPNNWIDRFGHSAWTFDEVTGQYYFATFAPEQPDLNWRNPAVQKEMLDTLRFWLNIGCDGVRVDALAHLIKDQRLRRNPRDPSYTKEDDPSNLLLPVYSQNQPELLGTIHDIKQVIADYPDRVFVV
jgi:alpha-glucosidase